MYAQHAENLLLDIENGLHQWVFSRSQSISEQKSRIVPLIAVAGHLRVWRVRSDLHRW